MKRRPFFPLLAGLGAGARAAGGMFTSGVSRPGSSDADIAGRKSGRELMRRAGASVRIDAAGNIFARRAGKENPLPPVLSGSHIDPVASGGNFDGELGMRAAVGG